VASAPSGTPYFKAEQFTVDTQQGLGLVNLVAGAQVVESGTSIMHQYLGEPRRFED